MSHRTSPTSTVAMEPLKNIVCWGVGGGNIGAELLKTISSDPAFNVTVLARHGSMSEYPDNVRVVRVDDTSHTNLVSALQGQDAVISAVGSTPAALNGQIALAKAAVEAGIKLFIPTGYGFDNGDPELDTLSPIFKMKHDVARELQALSEKSPGFSWTAVATGSWLDWGLGTAFLGIDARKHTVEYWDEGANAFTCTTMAYVAEGVVQILKDPRLFRNRHVFLHAFAASQWDIVAELERQQGVKYEATSVDMGGRLDGALEELKKGEGANPMAQFVGIQAVATLPGFHGDFVRAGMQPILADHGEMPRVTLEDVVREYLASH